MQDPHDAAEGVARWLSERTGEPVDFERVEPGDERVLPDREQRELDALPSVMALRYEAQSYDRD